MFIPNSREYNTLNEDDKIAIFRMVQEQLSNILKHANASNIVIRLEVMSNKVRLCIKDDGVGFNLSQCKKGLGLHNIYNRVEYYSGSIQIHTSEGNGCEMCITLKLRNTLPAQLKIA
jgi:signal transduction histidine kinase